MNSGLMKDKLRRKAACNPERSSPERRDATQSRRSPVTGLRQGTVNCSVASVRCRLQYKHLADRRKANDLMQNQTATAEEIVPLGLGTLSAFCTHKHLHVE